MHGYCLNLYANLGIETISEGLEMIELKSHLYRLENIKVIHDLAKAGVQHHVISVFLAAEGIELTALEVTNIVNTYDALGRERLPSKKVQSLITAKKMGQEDESLPCPV
mgnify:CR=1 FL=1